MSDQGWAERQTTERKRVLREVRALRHLAESVEDRLRRLHDDEIARRLADQDQPDG